MLHLGTGVQCAQSHWLPCPLRHGRWGSRGSAGMAYVVSGDLLVAAVGPFVILRVRVNGITVESL